MESTAMYPRIRHPWLVAYGATLAFYVHSALSGLEFIDFESFVVWFPVVSIGYLIFILLVWVIWALVWIPIRHFWFKRTISVVRSFVLTLRVGVLLGLVTLSWQTWLTTRPEHVQRVKDFAEATAPLLERYYDQHQRYPKSLGDLNLHTPVPWGLVYRTCEGPQMNEWPSCNRENETYSIFFGDLWYRGNKEWEFGGL